MTTLFPTGPSATSDQGMEALHDPGTQRIEGMPEILQLEKLDSLVGIHDEMLIAPLYATNGGPDNSKIEEKIAEAKNDLLRDAGFMVEAAGRSDEQTAAYEFADSILDRAIRSNMAEWMGDTTANGGHDGLRNQVFRELLSHYGAQGRAREETATVETEHGAEQLVALRKAKYDAFINKMKGSAFGKKRQELQEAYEEAERAYMVELTAANKQAIEDKRAELIALGKDDTEVAEELKFFAKQEAERINREDQDTQHQLLVERSGRMGRFLEWYGNQPLARKVALGMGLSALAIASGAGIGFLAGAAGGLVGGGIVTAAGYGLNRAWGAARMYQLRLASLYKFPTHHEKFELIDTDSADDLHLRQRSFLEKVSRDQLAEGEKVKKRAVYWTLGSLAVGSVAGVATHMIADGSWSHLFGGQTQHVWEQAHNNPTHSPSVWEREDVPDKTGIQVKLPPHTPEVTPPQAPAQPTAIDIWKGAPTESVLQKLYPGLDGRTAYLDINALYDKLGPNGVFTDASGHVIHLSEHSPNNIWIMQSSGKIQLSHDAQAYLDQLHGHSTGTNTGEAIQQAAAKIGENATPGSGTTVAETASNIGANEVLNGNGTTGALEQVINQGDVSPVNVVSRAEGWYQTFTELRRAGVVDIPSGQYDSFLRQVGPELAKLHYNDGTPVAYFDRFHYEWRMYASPRGEHLPPVALRTIARFAARNNYTLAA